MAGQGQGSQRRPLILLGVLRAGCSPVKLVGEDCQAALQGL